ncbi:hypothetical protein HH214_12085 [Mucilaginibacter robiniae]|uniref:Uncharacterized protein n=1 Tax=Mucilaginibacter robiniae TaxID=2728022 RepID=A0A7L5E4D0_9SPHI|nr:hypothetical protein [Mucilaginibacter robiniae]QJD96564.1 hypothetical protein HH214_12085 [Mucilaginibacter robiniae]
MSKTNTIGFSYKVEHITLQGFDDTLQVTNSFVTTDVIEQINQKLKDKNFKVDERSLHIKYVADQLYIDGFALEIQEPKTVGFLSGR